MMDPESSVAFRDASRFWVQCVCVPVVVFIGVLGNILSVYVFARSGCPMTSSNRYLTSLAISDTVFLLSSFTLAGKHVGILKSFKAYWDYVPVGLWLTDGFGATSVWITTCYSVQRCYVACRPMAHIATEQPKQTMLIILSTWGVCILLTVPTGFEWTTHEISIHNITKYNVELTVLGSDPVYKRFYYLFSAGAFSVLPFLILTIGNTKLIRALQMSQRNRASLCPHLPLEPTADLCLCCEWQVTFTLVVVICVFLCCHTPTTLVLIYTSIYTPEKDSYEENIILGIGNICNLLVALSSALNVFLYAFSNESFRNRVSSMFSFQSEERADGRRHEEIALDEIGMDI